ncbi:hypothetical protein F441_10842 [Phytophthora nicotianae CJ01A1]|nr:hypothetical protein L915_10655 [Phytophthora nicotianae]ETL37815.1 hypothetical protein L916_10544 [Phytophthora nicotianae]ETP14203.1 hypothetical protein F441_10842 [Phytophthora nicotianae CJ01A1]
MAPRRNNRQPSIEPLSAVFARHDGSWLHGQVVRNRGRDVVLQTKVGEQVTCRPTAVYPTDPVLALLLGPDVLDSSLDIEGVRTAHATILSRLLGDPANPRLRPSRDIVHLLRGIVADENMPDGARACVWSTAASSSHRFSLQHAVDFVFVTESSAKRISKAIRDGMGEQFFILPTSAAEDGASVAAEIDAPARRRDSETDRHARIVSDLMEFPDVLDCYLSARSRQNNLPTQRAKRTRLDSMEEPAEGSRKRPKSQFQPPAAHQLVHRLISATSSAGTSAHDFVDEMLKHDGVTFVQHPGVLIRIYDFQFGVRGLSIMHLVQLAPLDRMAWVMSSKVNMQDLSASVPLPDAQTAGSVDDILSALDGLRTYYAAFCAPDGIDLLQVMHNFVRQMIGISLWNADDLTYLVYWLNSILEEYRTCAHRDASTGETSRINVKDKVDSSNPDLQRLTQLITARKMEQLMQDSRRPSATVSARSPMPIDHTKDHVGTVTNTVHPLQRVTDGSTSTVRSGDIPQAILNLVPLQGGRTLCLRSTTIQGCTGAPGKPDQCQYFKSRAHFVPTEPLPKLLRDYIIQRFGGLRRDLHHL